MSELEAAVRDHARRVIARDTTVRADVAAGALLEPPDLFERLLAAPFRGFELVAHARVGAHHIFKTKYVGPTTLVVQARWVQEPAGPWRIHEAEIARVATGEGP